MYENASIGHQSQSSPAALASDVVPAQETNKPELVDRFPIQLKLSVGATNDPLEHEADAMADKVMRMPDETFIQRKGGCSCCGCDDEQVQLKSLATQITPFIQTKSDGESAASDSVSGRIKSSMGGGNLMHNNTKNFMESRFGTDFSDVKIHDTNESAQLSRSLNARAFTVSNNIYFNSGEYQPETDSGKHLLAHELTHVMQQGNKNQQVQRKIKLLQFSWPPSWNEMGKKERKTFLHKYFAHNNLATRVLEDMASADDDFDFLTENELINDITKRVSTSNDMQESQKVQGVGLAFGYPFTGDSLYYGPRVNYAAKDFWQPAVVDNYDIRKDKAKRKKITDLPRGERHTVYNDPASTYEWTLTDLGKKNPYDAILKLFVGQLPHKRSLIHCDYLISLVQIRAFAELIGKADFNARVQAFGADKIKLKWNAFADFDIAALGGKPNPIGALQSKTPGSEEDLVIGDHVVFWNHAAYDLINFKVGNAWRLENAILIDKVNGEDIFLGHGSGKKTKRQMKEKLAAEYNDVAGRALSIANSKAGKSMPESSVLSDKFPFITKVTNQWHIKGAMRVCPAIAIDKKLEKINYKEVIGLKSPCDPKIMNIVHRPKES